MKGSGTLMWKKKKESRFQSATPLTFLWRGGGPIRNIMSFLSLTQSALRCTADLPQCCTLHISGRWRDPAKEKRKKLLGIFYFFIRATGIILRKKNSMKSISETSLNVGEWRLICVTLLRTLAQGYRSFVKAYSSLQIIQAKGLEWKKAKEKEKKKTNTS